MPASFQTIPSPRGLSHSFSISYLPSDEQKSALIHFLKKKSCFTNFSTLLAYCWEVHTPVPLQRLSRIFPPTGSAVVKDMGGKCILNLPDLLSHMK